MRAEILRRTTLRSATKKRFKLIRHFLVAGTGVQLAKINTLTLHQLRYASFVIFT